jgi:RNA 2',3'-cyclic 3'-phosphodiesterase
MAWRTFIAIELPASVRERLQAPIDALAPIGDALRGGRPEGIHLTLHFLGAVEEGSIAELADRVGAALRGQQPLTVEVAGVGAFPSIPRAQVLYADIGGPQRERLIALQASIRPALEGAGLPIEARPFKPHLTLARARRPLRAEERRAVEAWSEKWKPVRFGQMDVGGVSLFRSELGGGPPRYTTLREFPLQ